MREVNVILAGASAGLAFAKGYLILSLILAAVAIVRALLPRKL
jgi:hypothetical protein